MILYHGSKTKNIEHFRIIPRDNNIPEFGDGIYFTPDYKKALEWSCHKCNEGAVYKINIDLSKLKGKEITVDDDLFYYVSYLNRIDMREVANECMDEIKGKDYVFGRVLKDIIKFQENAEKFNSGDLTLSAFKEQTRTIRGGFIQYCFRTPKAVELINSSDIFRINTRKRGKSIIEDGNWLSKEQ